MFERKGLRIDHINTHRATNRETPAKAKPQYLSVDFFKEENITHPVAEIVEKQGDRIIFCFDEEAITVAKLIEDIVSQAPILKFSLEETKIDDIIRLSYQKHE